MLLQVLLAMALVLSLIVPVSAAGASATVHWSHDRSIRHLAADSSSLASAMALNTLEGSVNPMVAAGNGFIYGRAQVRRHSGRRGR